MGIAYAANHGWFSVALRIEPWLADSHCCRPDSGTISAPGLD